MVLIIFKMIATSGFLTALESTKFVSGRGSTPDPTGELTVPPDSLAGLRGLLLRGEGRERGKKDGNGRGRKGGDPPFANSWITPEQCQYHKKYHKHTHSKVKR